MDTIENYTDDDAVQSLPITQVTYTGKNGQPIVIWGAPGVPAETLLKQVPSGCTGQEITKENAEALFDTLESVKATKLSEILTAANTASAAIKAKYSQPEIDSWQQQESEARALLADPETSAPLVRDLADNTGVTPMDFAQRIVNNADAAAAATKAIILQQQAMEKAVKDAANVQAVQAVRVSYTLA